MYSFAMQSQRDSAQVIHSNARSSENNRELMEQWVMCLLLTFKSEYCFCSMLHIGIFQIQLLFGI